MANFTKEKREICVKIYKIKKIDKRIDFNKKIH